MPAYACGKLKYFRFAQVSGGYWVSLQAGNQSDLLFTWEQETYSPAPVGKTPGDWGQETITPVEYLEPRACSLERSQGHLPASILAGNRVLTDWCFFPSLVCYSI